MPGPKTGVMPFILRLNFVYFRLLSFTTVSMYRHLSPFEIICCWQHFQSISNPINFEYMQKIFTQNITCSIMTLQNRSVVERAGSARIFLQVVNEFSLETFQVASET